MYFRIRTIWAALAVLAMNAAVSASEPAPIFNPKPELADWTALGRLPDWTGTWQPDVTDWMKKSTTEPVPWTPSAAAKIKDLQRAEAAGNPRGVHNTCLPLGMPGSMMINFNLLEFLFTPGRVTMLGETDGNILRRIYTDGRPHPKIPEPTFYGHSVGHWEGPVLIVDTVDTFPETELSLNETVGIANGGGMHIVERFRLSDADTMEDALEITAPHVLTAPWKTARLFHRHRERTHDIVEGVCAQDTVDKTNVQGEALFDTTLPP